MDNSKLRVGIIGCGRISPLHAISVRHQPQAELAAICDLRAEARAELAKQCGNPPGYADFEEMIRQERLDVVHICLPHYLHAPVAVRAMELGCHVLTEKPMAISMEQARQMVAAADRHHRQLGVIFQNRYNPGSRLLKRCIYDGTLGKIISAKCTVTWFRDDSYYLESDWKGTWDKEGGGVMVNQAIHTLDLMCWLLGYGIDTVECSIANRFHHESMETEDCAEGLISFKNGALASFWCTICYGRDADVELEVFGEHGIGTIRGAEGTVRLNDGRILAAGPQDEAAAAPGADAPAYWGCSHEKEIADFYARLAAGQEPPITGREILDTAHRMLMSLYLSGRKHRIVHFDTDDIP